MFFKQQQKSWSKGEEIQLQVKRNKNILFEDELGKNFKIRTDAHAVVEHYNIFNLLGIYK